MENEKENEKEMEKKERKGVITIKSTRNESRINQSIKTQFINY